ncbi:hypothetical protein IAD21_01606 [Abditibacteriota bacterium]|nr:hypothetical protein IAD21_01606 [Abditibacteriota bacterium]
MLMKVWLRVPFAILALLAMFATLLPETVWVCPMTGRVDVATRVCAMPTVNGQMPCAKFGGKCCKPLSVPASPANDDDSGRSHIFTASHHVSFALDFPPLSFESPVFVEPTVVLFEAPAVRHYLARFANSPPTLWTQYKSLSHSGRAPPVL